VNENVKTPNDVASSAQEQYDLEHLAKKYGLHPPPAKTYRTDEGETRGGR
jgi:hypothetical protein